MKKQRKSRKRKKSRYKRGEYTSTKSGEVCKYRSGWEAKFMEYLDSSPTVLTWHYEALAIEYTSNVRSGKKRKYYPDFTVTMLDGTMRVIEVKPKRKLEQAVVIKKAIAAKEWCRTHGATYEILTEVELKVLGLL